MKGVAHHVGAAPMGLPQLVPGGPGVDVDDGGRLCPICWPAYLPVVMSLGD
jgi:hypothetical protein